eukprot:TRINITY_DN2284_c0_g1_i3.p1 TRINITY_DN2284_c0_g1~~TRINITY_DN2284_c0_g1_i3.p1  ORF type:complete len:588 (-),score=-2.49 TRINITY_DN2284_c0_g1_i3:24-1787(-)
MASSNIFVGNLSQKTDKHKLKTHFQHYQIIHARIIRRNRKSLGYGFITLDGKESATEFIQEMNKKSIDGRAIRVELAKPREKIIVIQDYENPLSNDDVDNISHLFSSKAQISPTKPQSVTPPRSTQLLSSMQPTIPGEGTRSTGRRKVSPSIDHLQCRVPQITLQQDILQIPIGQWGELHFPCHFARSFPTAVRVVEHQPKSTCNCKGVHNCLLYDQPVAATEIEKCERHSHRHLCGIVPQNVPAIEDWLTALQIDRGPLNVPLPAEPNLCLTQRSRPQVWLCNGSGISIPYNDFYQTRSWSLGIVMSYPVSDRHLMYSRDGSGFCATLRNVSHRLLKPYQNDILEHIFISDIFPYVGHPSTLGASHPNNEEHQLAKRLQAERLLLASPLVLVISGQAARDAFDRAIDEKKQQWQFFDMTEELGIPACFVIIKGRATLILAQRHPCCDKIGFPMEDYEFGTRSSLVRSILERSPIIQCIPPERMQTVGGGAEEAEIEESEEPEGERDEAQVALCNRNESTSEQVCDARSGVVNPVCSGPPVSSQNVRAENRNIFQNLHKGTNRQNHYYNPSPTCRQCCEIYGWQMPT